METTAWRGARFTYPARIPTMISREEKQYLYWLGSRCWSGRGQVVEVGPWLGGSTACLAAGMRESGHPTSKRLRVFDNFIWREFMAERAALPLKPGESFRLFFENNLTDYADVIETTTRALPDEEVGDDPDWVGRREGSSEGVPLLSAADVGDVEILFIDGAKSWLGIKSLFAALSERLLPGTTLIVCQDFKYWSAYWVPVFLARLHAHFEPVHNVISATTVTFRLVSALSPKLMDDLESHVAQLPERETLGQLDDASHLLERSGDRAGALNVGLGKVCFQAHSGRLDKAGEQLGMTQQAWPLSVRSRQLELARGYLRGRGLSVPRPFLLHLASLLPRRLMR